MYVWVIMLCNIFGINVVYLGKIGEWGFWEGEEVDSRYGDK